MSGKISPVPLIVVLKNSGMTFEQIAKELNGMGLMTTHGKPYTVQSVYQRYRSVAPKTTVKKCRSCKKPSNVLKERRCPECHEKWVEWFLDVGWWYDMKSTHPEIYESGKRIHRIERGYYSEIRMRKRAEKSKRICHRKIAENPEKYYERRREIRREYFRKYPEQYQKQLLRSKNHMAYRRSISTELSWFEYRLIRKTYGKCLCCGSTENLTIDHVVPICDGGGLDVSNIQLLCRSCNSRKHAHHIDYRNGIILTDEDVKKFVLNYDKLNDI